MAAFSRRMQIVGHLLSAAEHQNAAMQLLLEEDRSTTPAVTEANAPVEEAKRMSEQPTLISPRFTAERALDELKKASRSASTAEEYGRVQDMAKRMVESGLIAERDARPFLIYAPDSDSRP